MANGHMNMQNRKMQLKTTARWEGAQGGQIGSPASFDVHHTPAGKRHMMKKSEQKRPRSHDLLRATSSEAEASHQAPPPRAPPPPHSATGWGPGSCAWATGDIYPRDSMPHAILFAIFQQEVHFRKIILCTPNKLQLSRIWGSFGVLSLFQLSNFSLFEFTF